MFNYLVTTAPSRSLALGKRRLTPNDARALWSLSDKTGTPIGALAKIWKCDPSNATFIVDRLVQAGHARRDESASDRRVKLVRLTPQGARMKAELLAEYLVVPADLASLPQADLKVLVGILEKLDSGGG